MGNCLTGSLERWSKISWKVVWMPLALARVVPGPGVVGTHVGVTIRLSGSLFWASLPFPRESPPLFAFWQSAKPLPWHYIRVSCEWRASLVAQMVKNPLQCRKPGFHPWRREWLSTPVFLPGEFHGQKSLGGYNPCGHRKSDTTEQLTPKVYYFLTSRALREGLLWLRAVPDNPLVHRVTGSESLA